MKSTFCCDMIQQLKMRRYTLYPRKGTAMKKILLIMLVFSLLFCLCACTAEPQVTEPSADSSACAVHTWKAANCFFAKTCTVCGATDGNPNEHSWNNGICTVCGLVEMGNDPLTVGTWFYITKQKWSVYNFHADGTCDIIDIFGLPKAGATIEECVAAAVAQLKMESRDQWEDVAKNRYHIFKILDYYYAGNMATQTVEYTVSGDVITLQQEGFLPLMLRFAGRSKLVNENDDLEYVRMPFAYEGNLWYLYQTMNEA